MKREKSLKAILPLEMWSSFTIFRSMKLSQRHSLLSGQVSLDITRRLKLNSSRNKIFFARFEAQLVEQSLTIRKIRGLNQAIVNIFHCQLYCKDKKGNGPFLKHKLFSHQIHYIVCILGIILTF